MDEARHLVFAPHHDDEVLGCGGTIARARERGEAARVVVVTSGELSGLDLGADEQVAAREAECRAACGCLGVADVTFLREPDRSLTYGRKLMERIAAEIVAFRPTILYAPHADEADREHRVVAELVREAAMLAQSGYSPLPERAPRIRLHLQYEVWTPMRSWQLAVDITAVQAQKRAAMQCYGSQLARMQLDEAIAGLNRYRAVQAGKGTYAEVFHYAN